MRDQTNKKEKTMKTAKDFLEHVDEGRNLTPDNSRPQILKYWDSENAYVKINGHVHCYTWNEMNELYF